MIVRDVTIGGRTFRAQLQPANKADPGLALQSSQWSVSLDSRQFVVNSSPVGKSTLSLIIDGNSYKLRVERRGEALQIFLNGRVYECSVRDPRSLGSRSRSAGAKDSEKTIKASMPGKVVRLLARPGDNVAAGQGLLVIEAMKMQNEVRSARGGTVKSLAVREGANVNAGDLLAVIE